MRWFAAVCALLSTAAPAAWAKLELVNIKAVYGRLGPERPDLKVLPYDQVFFRFDITGIKPNAAGEAEVSTVVVIVDPDGRATSADPVNAKVSLTLGGDRLPSFATVALSPEQKPGQYDVEVRVTDLVGGESALFSRTLELRPPTFGIASLNFTHDPEGHVPAPAGGLVGHVVFVRFLVVGFEKAKGKIEFDAVMRVLTSDGKPTTPKPVTNTFRTVKPAEVKEARTVTVVTPLLLHRPGKFTLEITVNDRVGGKSARTTVPLTVTAVDPEPAAGSGAAPPQP